MTYTGRLNYFDGTTHEITIPGKVTKGVVCVPETITTSDGRFFELLKPQESLEVFDYFEAVPYQMHLH